jgi:hypothetical protein
VVSEGKCVAGAVEGAGSRVMPPGFARPDSRGGCPYMHCVTGR